MGIEKIAASLLAAAAAVAPSVVSAAHPADVLQKNNCTACHAAERKVVGPAFRDIAAKYRGDKSAENKLVSKVRSGGAGAWGSLPMPPQKISEAEARLAVQLILQMK